MGFPGDSVIKNCLPMKEMLVPPLGQEDFLERKWQSTPVFLPGEPRGQRNLALQCRGTTVHGVTKSWT